MRVIGYYTDSYAADASLLVRSMDRIGVPHFLVHVHERGSWDANTGHKATFLHAQRRFWAGPLLYVDVDAFMHHDPREWLREHVGPEVDFAAHWFAGPGRGWNTGDVCRCVQGGECDKPHRMLAGTLYLGDTPGCAQLLAAWCFRNRMKREAGDGSGGGQRNLWEAIEETDGLTTARLPGRFAYVFDKPWAYPADEPRWIEHTIASRENRPRRDMQDRGFWRRTNKERRRRIAQLEKLVR